MRGMPVWQLDQIQFNTEQLDDDGIEWIAENIEGFWGTPGPDAAYTAKVGRHGSFRTPGYKEKQAITLTCSAYARRDDYPALRRAMLKASALCADPDQGYELTCFSEVGALTMTVYLDGDILTAPRVQAQQPAMEFSVQLTAPDPRKYAAEWRHLETQLPSTGGDGLDFGTGGGLDFLTSGGLRFGTSETGGFLELRNDGTAPTYPVLTLYGPLTTPTIATGAGSLRYNGVLADGEWVVIDPDAPSVLFGGTTNQRNLLSPAQFAAFTIPKATASGPGVLTVGLSHAGPSTATGRLVAEFRSAWF